MKINNVKITVIPTKSSTYFLPVLDSLVDFKFLHLLRNSYVINNEEEKAFSVLYQWNGGIEFTSYEEELMNHTLFIGHEDYGQYVLYKFRLPENAAKILKLFIAGKYSDYPYEIKNLVRDFVKARGFSNYDRIFQILNREDSIRLQMEKDLGITISPHAELSSPPEMDTENFSNYVTQIDINSNPEF